MERAFLNNFINSPLNQLKIKINVEAEVISSLKEGIQKDISKHSQLWQEYYSVIEKDILNWLSQDKQFVQKTDEDPLSFYINEKRNILLKMIFKAVEHYNVNLAGNGKFIAFQSMIITRDIRKRKKKNLNEFDSQYLEETYGDDTENHNSETTSEEEIDFIKKSIIKFADLTEIFFNKSKAGMELKKDVYSFFMIQVGLLKLPEDFAESLYSKYSFLNKDAIEYFREKQRNCDSYKKVLQKDFSNYTGHATTKFSHQRDVLIKYIQENCSK